MGLDRRCPLFTQYRCAEVVHIALKEFFRGTNATKYKKIHENTAEIMLEEIRSKLLDYLNVASVFLSFSGSALAVDAKRPVGPPHCIGISVPTSRFDGAENCT